MKKKTPPRFTWTTNDEKYFLERYSQLTITKASYIVGQAKWLLFFNVHKEEAIYNAIERLLNRYFEDFPDADRYKGLALLLKGKICHQKGAVDDALMYYKEAAELEMSNLEVNYGAWIEYATLAIKLEKVCYYDRVEQMLLTFYDSASDLICLYDASALLTAIAEYHGDFDKEKYYRYNADEALTKLTKINKRLRYMKVIETKDDVNNLISEYLVKNDFFLGDLDGNTYWQRFGFFCKNNLLYYVTYDRVFIIAFISYRDVISNAAMEMGLTGPLVGFSKWPFKKIIKKLAKLIENQKRVSANG